MVLVAGAGATMRLMIEGQYIIPFLGTLARPSASEIRALGPNCALLLMCHALAAASVSQHRLDGKRTRGAVAHGRAGVQLTSFMLSRLVQCRAVG